MPPNIAEPIALVDMDGTLCDYEGAMRRDLEALRAPSEPPLAPDLWTSEHLPHMKARMDLVKRQSGWWRELHAIPENFEVLAVMRRLAFDIHILTKGPWRTTSAWSEKVDWCREHVPNASVHISEDKGLVYGKVLMDDYPPYIRRWLEWRPRGQVIMPAWPWNADFSHPNVLRYDGTNLDAVSARLWEVRQTALYAPDEMPTVHATPAHAACPACGALLAEHPFDLAALDDDRRPYLRIACDGRRVTLG